MAQRYFRFSFLIFSFCLLLAACTPTSAIDNGAGNSGNVPAGDSDAIITLERTACFGTCPIYKVTVYGDGRVVYDGRDFVETVGEQIYQVDPADVLALIDFMVDGGYQELKDNYTERLVSDMPSTITSLTIDGETKQIDHYFGDDSAPLLLFQVESRIDMLVQADQWTGQDSSEMNRTSIFGQLLVRGEGGETELPEGAIVTVRMEDVSLLDAPSVLIVETVYDDLAQLPTFYDLVVDLNELDAMATYTVSAEVTSADGELLYWTDTAFEVLGYGMGSMVDIELVPAQ